MFLEVVCQYLRGLSVCRDGQWCAGVFDDWFELPFVERGYSTVGCVLERSLGGGTVADRGEGCGLPR